MNIYDIAREAGVSIATISRVLNNKGTVSPATRAKVEAVLARYNYTPSAIARGMVSRSMRTVAVLTADIRVPRCARTVYTLEREFRRRGYDTLLCNTGSSRDETLRALSAVRKKQVDGIVLAGSVFGTLCQGAEMEKLLTGVPVVLANGRLTLPTACSVRVDEAYGAALAVEHLVRQGRKNLYYLQEQDTPGAKARWDGFRAALARAGLESRGHLLHAGETPEESLHAVRQLLAADPRPDGLLCGGELTATGALKALRQAGYCVPGQVAVIACSDSDYARLSEPALTALDTKPEQMALLCVQLLESRMAEDGACSSVTLQPELVERETG